MLSFVEYSPTKPRLGVVIRHQDHHFRKIYEDAMANGEIETTYVLIEGSRPDFEKRKKQKREKDTEAKNKILDDEKKRRHGICREQVRIMKS